ncbi:winged helix-turn-helix transcriptional regulator [Candidatus Sumerlaeota bacterium]|nr:winged helix-turn-helix transcriptional regulator [Candidatus Sumerlaeota bacterium]
MNKKLKEYYSARATIIKALAHPTRIFIVEQLEKGERCVCELQEMIGDDISTVSKHLAILKNAGFISDDKRGLKIFYSLNMPCALNFLECAKKILKNRARHDLALTCK